MQFRLLYEGALKSNGSVEHKHELRRCFHTQLKELVQRKPFEPKKNLSRPNMEGQRFFQSESLTLFL
jgi:hypothetical protein